MDKTEKAERRKRGALFARAWRKEFGEGVTADLAGACRIYRALYEKLYAEEGQEPLDLLKKHFVDWYDIQPEEAIRCIRESAGLHNEEAMLLLARCYEEGACVERDLDEAVRLYRHAADIGLGEAMLHLGRMYATGTGVPQDMEAAVHHYGRAAAQGYREAQWCLAKCYERGLGGLPVDLRQAARRYRWAVQIHCATRRVVPHFEQCKSGVKTTPVAIARYLKEIQHDNPEAQYCYAVCLETGRGVRQNLKEAAKWYRSAAECGGYYEVTGLARFYEEHPGLALSEEEASFRFLNAAQLNDDSIFPTLAKRYEYGIGIERSPQEAAYWYRRDQGMSGETAENTAGLQRLFREIGDEAMFPIEAPSPNTLCLLHRAEAGHADAQRAIGLDYLDGDGIDQDEQKAFHWLRLASEQGDSYAQYWLAHCYRYGRGTEADHGESLKWLRLSAAQNERIAVEDLSRE